MIQTLHDITEHLAWLDAFICDPRFSSPFCSKERILSLAEKDTSLLLGAYEGQRLTGLFCLMVLDAEKYIETLFLYTESERAYENLLEYLSAACPGYEMWFVYNPKNPVLENFLFKKQAFFYEEQRYMEYNGATPEEPDGIIPYHHAYKEEYIRMHSKDGYWDGGKMLEQQDNFYIFLCVRDNRLIGYIDCSKGTGTNEVMDIRVLPEYRSQGIGALLLRKALFINRGNRLVLTVDTDNAPANHLYEKLGFQEISMNNLITAKLVL